MSRTEAYRWRNSPSEASRRLGGRQQDRLAKGVDVGRARDPERPWQALEKDR